MTTSTPLHAVAVDVGGSTIKGAVVDLASGVKLGKRLKVATPEESTPRAVSRAVAALVDVLSAEHPDASGLPLGVTIPGTVIDGVVRFVGNLDPAWVGTDASALLREELGAEVAVLNDADAAALAEARFGAARGMPGLVIMTTLGTGIGSGLLYDGRLVPHSELGQIQIDGERAEVAAAASARTREDLSWRDWAARLERYYRRVEDLLLPDAFVIGGGITKKADKFIPLLDVRTPIRVAELRNDAGIIGAGLVAQKLAVASSPARSRTSTPPSTP